MSTSNIKKSNPNNLFDDNGFTQRQKDIINSCIRDEEKRNQEKNNEGIHTHEIKALVEGTSRIKNNKNDTFITQRGGKMYAYINENIKEYIHYKNKLENIHIYIYYNI